MARRYQIPQSSLTGNLYPRIEWTNYLGGIEEIGNRVAANVAALGASPTNAEIATAFNALLSALKTANLQNSS